MRSRDIVTMGARSIHLLCFLLLGIWRMSMFCAAAIEEPTAPRRTFIRLYVGQSTLRNEFTGGKGEEEKEGRFPNFSLMQFHVLSQAQFSADNNLTKVDAFCNLAVAGIVDITRNYTERRVEEEDELGTLLRRVSNWDSIETMQTICRRDVVHRTSDHYFSFVYSKMSTTPNTSRWIRPPPPFNMSKQYRKGFSFNPDTGDVKELLWHEAFDAGVMRAESTNGESFDISGWNVHLDSELSKSGGMHRDLHHTLHFHANESNISIPSNETYSGTVDMLLHLPSDLFINIEDCFHWKNDPKSVLRIENISALPSTLIDQEEPAFVSPSHLLLIRIELMVILSPTLPAESITKEVDQGRAGIQASLEFTTQLHARYPKPLPSLNRNNFQLVVFPPPVLISGSLSKGNMKLTGNWMLWVKTEEFEWLQWWVAPGHQWQYPLVLGVTIATAVLGALYMWRDLSRVSVWD